MKYQHKPNVVQAMRYTGTNLPEVQNFIGNNYHAHRQGLFVKSKAGPMKVSTGDWIVKRAKDDFYPVKPEIFLASYEAVYDQGDQ